MVDRPTRILRALRDAPDGLSTPELVKHLGESDGQLLNAYGSILRRLQQSGGQVEIVGKTIGGRQKPPALIWGITDVGRDHLARRESALDRKSKPWVMVDFAEAIAARNHVLALAVASYSRETPILERRRAVASLRELGCTRREISQIFGVTGEMIRQDLIFSGAHE